MQLRKKDYLKYLRSRFPEGAEIFDRTRGSEPYRINRYSVFEIKEWTADDYNDVMRPDKVEDYDIDFSVRNPGQSTPSYFIRSSTVTDVKYWIERHGTKI